MARGQYADRDRDGADALARPIARGGIDFDAVDFHYADGARVFWQFSLNIPAGQRVGLVGFSGSGKSTFVSLLLRFYDPQRGSIRIDGQEVRTFTQDSLHAQLGLIPQDPTLFHRTLRENIRYGRPQATDAEVEDAARRAHAAEFIRAIPGGLPTRRSVELRRQLGPSAVPKCAFDLMFEDASGGQRRQAFQRKKADVGRFGAQRFDPAQKLAQKK